MTVIIKPPVMGSAPPDVVSDIVGFVGTARDAAIEAARSRKGSQLTSPPDGMDRTATICGLAWPVNFS